MINYFSPKAKAVFVILLGSYASNSVADEALTYTVKPHDTWGKIARRTLDSPERLAALQALNQQNANTLPQAGSVLRVQPEWRRVLPQQAKVLALTGEPKLVDKRRGMQTLVVGQLLRRGSQIVTDGDASVVLQFADASRLQLYPDSQLTVVKLAKGPRNLPIIKVDLTKVRLIIKWCQSPMPVDAMKCAPPTLLVPCVERNTVFARMQKVPVQKSCAVR